MKARFAAIAMLIILTTGMFSSNITASYIEDTELFDIGPGGNYDKIVNLAELNETSASAWTHMPEGRFIESIIPESKFRSNRLTKEDNIVLLTQEMTFETIPSILCGPLLC